MRNLLVILLFVLAPAVVFSQTGREVSGIVRDTSGQSVIAASVKLTSSKDTLFTRTDVNGNYVFRGVKSSQFLLTVTSLGYRNFNQKYLFKDGVTPIKINPITLKSRSNVLNEVVVTGAMPVTVKEDTVEYRASDYPVRENSVAEDILKKLPGVEVDKDGNVTTQGKSVTRVRVNGKDFFDGDLKTATQNLPADIIEKIQIVDDYGDQANVSGIKDGDPDKILNITISPSKNKGMIANMVAGAGSDAKKDADVSSNDGRYQATGMAHFMNNDKQFSVLVNLNNTNASLFDFVGGGNQRGGRFRAGGGMMGNSGSGITNTQAGGFNFRSDISKKISIYGNYSFQHRDNNTLQTSYSNTAGMNVVNNSSSDANTISDNHRFNFNLEYKMDSLNYLKVSPSVYYSKGNSNSITNAVIQEASRQDQKTIAQGNSDAPTLGGDILYNHRFVKPGRNLSLSFSVNHSKTNNDQDNDDTFRFYNAEDLGLYTDSASHRLINVENVRNNILTNLVYSEPLSKNSRLDFSYNLNRTSYDNSRITSLEGAGGYVPVDSLSNVFNYSFTTNQFGLSYRYDKGRLYNFSIGLSAQPTLLKGYSETSDVNVDRSGFNFFPTARFVYNFARTRSLNVNYSGSSSEPSYTQIQPVVDLSNPQRPVVGNPDLKSSFNQNINVRYNNFDPAGGSFFMVGLAANITSDKIVTDIVRRRQAVITGADTSYNLIQETRYLNTSGYYASNGFYSWSKPFADRKYTLHLNGSANFTNDVSFSDNEKNIGKTWSFSQGLRFQINPNQDIDITPGVSYRRSWVDYSLPASTDVKNSTVALSLSGKIYFFKTFIWGFDGSKNINNNLQASVNSNPLIINSYLEKEFFNRRGRLRFQGYDLLNQGVNVSTSDSGGIHSETSTNRLTRYFLVSFALRLNKFPGGVQPNNNFRGRGNGGFRPEGGGPPMGGPGF